MYKTKLCGFAIACMAGLLYMSPINTYAAETNTESVKLSEENNNQRDRRTAFDEKLKKSQEKWNALTPKQKEEVYSLYENRIQSENKLLDKLVQFGVIEKEDAALIKAHRLEYFNKAKKSGEFPMLKPRTRQIRK